MFSVHVQGRWADRCVQFLHWLLCMKPVLECDSSRAGQCVWCSLELVHTCSQVTAVFCARAGCCCLIPPGSGMERIGCSLLHAFFFLHKICQWVGLQLWVHYKGVFFGRLRQINRRAFLSVRSYRLKGTVLTRGNLWFRNILLSP